MRRLCLGKMQKRFSNRSSGLAESQSISKKRNLRGRVILNVLYLGLRYYAAYTLLGYGFAKIMGAQFTVLDSQLAKPMGDVSGFWLTWYYFGYSPVYSDLTAIFQVAGAVLLCFRRMALIAALVLLPVMVNIVCIDIWVIRFPLQSGALRNAIYVLVALLGIVLFHAGELYRFFIRRRDNLAFFANARLWLFAIQAVIVAGMVAYTAHESYWVANVNNRAPTPIDGAWHVVQFDPTLPDIPDWIYFEYNRAFMTVFHFPSGKSEVHDFRVDKGQRTLTISERWLTPGSNIFEGKWDRDGDVLELRGVWRNSVAVNITLKRKHERVKDHR